MHLIGHLGVELHREPEVADREGLVVVGVAGREQRRALGQRVMVAVPFEHPDAGDVPDRRGEPGLGELHLAIAEIRPLALVVPPAEGSGHELRAEAHPEDRLLGLDAPADVRQLVGQVRVQVGLIGPLLAAEHDEQVAVPGVECRDVLGRRVDDPDVVAALAQDGLEVAECDVVVVLEHDRSPRTTGGSQSDPLMTIVSVGGLPLPGWW